jgi:hypothetical protein
LSAMSQSSVSCDWTAHFQSLKGVKRVSRRWQLVGDEPINAYAVKQELDAAGHELLFGNVGSSELA